MVKKYIPDAGDFAWLSLDPRRGHEQKGRRPILVLSRKEYNLKSKLVLACPVTSVSKGYPFEVLINGSEVEGVIMADQVASFAFEERKIAYITKADNEVLDEVRRKIKLVIG